ncbi:uncharacterized protein B0I36DRAFT_368098 [Microdochium trichocladiopsis]|uniref:Rhodopsin domain-containing protein n=1 Tax=Microdochium trichocladiopsis TaxID=1682393 RepID=A0A9P9BMQ7_9PEZI|nr:uncharacterized protein B0I36DRAFT_368098 [Microdochium trichocladiopsis]KAH7018047.1 hypothetical protein B0I36DRAFT_368098 [Microdochium trichocladiopsis]
MSDQPPPMASDDVVLRDTPGYRGDTQLYLNSFLIAFSALFVGLRLYARCFMVKRPGIDDIIAVLCLGCLVALSVMEIRLVQVGSGTHIRFVSENRLFAFFDALTTQSLLYFWCVCLMRLHIAAFLPNLHNDKRYVRLVWGVGGITLVSTIIFFIVKMTSCKPVSAMWLPPFIAADMCMSGNALDQMMTVHAALGIAIDISLVALPVWVIYTKMIFSKRKFRVILIFAVGIFVIITGLVRFILIRTTPFNEDATYSMSTIGQWTDLEGHVGLWCGCFPALQPILRSFLTSIGASRLLSSSKRSRTGGEAYGYGPGKAGPNGSRGWNRSNAIPLSSGPKGGTNHDDNDNNSQKGIIQDDFELVEVGRGKNRSRDIVKNTRVQITYQEGGSSSEEVSKSEVWTGGRAA